MYGKTDHDMRSITKEILENQPDFFGRSCITAVHIGLDFANELDLIN